MGFWVIDGFRVVKDCGKGCGWCMEVWNGVGNGWWCCGKVGWWLELMEKLRIEGFWVMVAAAKVGENVADEKNEK